MRRCSLEGVNGKVSADSKWTLNSNVSSFNVLRDDRGNAFYGIGQTQAQPQHEYLILAQTVNFKLSITTIGSMQMPNSVPTNYSIAKNYLCYMDITMINII